MKLQLFMLYCALQAIHSFNISDYIIYPPDESSVRVVGGKDAPDGVAPFQISLQWDREHLCGGSIIADQYVLTASHCVFGLRGQNLEVLVGTNDLKKGGKYYKVANFTTHEHYNSPIFANDIAVVKLQGKIEFNEKVQPIEISNEEIPDGAQVQLTGWGRLKARGDEPSWLQILHLEAVSTKRCIEQYHRQSVHESHFCTWSPVGEGVCNGDSGGPLVYQNKVIGVVNFAVPCAMGFPDAFAKVSYFHTWIKSHME